MALLTRCPRRLKRGASLLAVGVVSMDGTLAEGAVVRVVYDGTEFARGVLSRSPGADAPDRRPLIHRDDLVLV